VLNASNRQCYRDGLAGLNKRLSESDSGSEEAKSKRMDRGGGGWKERAERKRDAAMMEMF